MSRDCNGQTTAASIATINPLVPPPMLMAACGHLAQCHMVLVWLDHLFPLLPLHIVIARCSGTQTDACIASTVSATDISPSTHLVCSLQACYTMWHGSGLSIPQISITLLPYILGMKTWPFWDVQGLQWPKRGRHCNPYALLMNIRSFLAVLGPRQLHAWQLLTH